ncbi:MAG: RdgB/HAM1 family non-canonical purine NTP pyrophosphatase [Deltaproteobacteria bacterium]|nr:RdgB/HAM1 family non-canonical purine NTP pyrophosphatase [Deltaproteobacteria bacterium]
MGNTANPMTLVLATHNRGKCREISQVLKDLPIRLLSTADFKNCPKSEEPFETYLENARDKARLVSKHTGHWVLADDSGLEVKALGGAPGVKSARYAGEEVSYLDNNEKILTNLKSIQGKDRAATFISLMLLLSPQGEEWLSVGKLEGEIALEAKGDHGFGYDPIFYLPNQKKHLAELSLEEKNLISHRRQALEGIKKHLVKILETTPLFFSANK